MARKEITTPLDLKNLDNHNQNYKEIYNVILNVKNTNNIFIYEAQQVLNKAKKYNFDNSEVQKQLNNLIIESGNANAEVSQARGHYSVLNERLNAEFLRLMQSETQANRSIIATSKRKFPMITFIDDDGRTEVLEKWEPILQEKGNKLTIPLITQWMDDPDNTNVITWEDVHRLKKEYGVEFVSHTHTHGHGNQMTAQQIDDDLRDAKRVLQREGLSHDIIVQPYGENSDDVRKISRDYAKINIGTKEFVNTTPLDTFRAGRISLGEDLYTTFEQYKEKLDEAIANDGWIIFKSHSQYTSFDENQQQLIRQIIDYARANNISEVSVEEGISYFGNLIDVGDYTARAQGIDYYVMDRYGKVHSNFGDKNFWNHKFNSVDIDTPVTHFKEGSTNTVSIISTNAKGFPDNASGQLITFRSESITLSYQLYLPSDSDAIFKRRWDNSNNVWLPFKKIVNDLVEFTEDFLNHKFNSVDIDTPVTHFKEGSTNTVSIISTNAKGFPNNKPGQLITFRSESISLSYQLYLPSNSDTIFKRRWDSSNNVWLPFKKIADDLVESTTNQYTPQTILPANSSADVDISNTVLTDLGFKAGDLIVGSPERKIVDGVAYNIYIFQDNTITVRYTNATTTEKTVNATYFNFKISRVK